MPIIISFMIWLRLKQGTKLGILLLLFLSLLAPEWPAFGAEAYQIKALIGQRQFDFLVWEVEAITAKVEAILAKGQTYLSPERRQQLVLDYLGKIGWAQQLEADITQIYIDPSVDDPDVVSAALQAEQRQVRAEITAVQPLAEAIVQEQVAAVLAEEGFQVLGQTWPPVMMHMTPLPTLLVVSPRDHIERKYAFSLQPGLTTAMMDELETAIFEELNLSALVVPLGGMGTYPAMIMETSSINWLTEVTAHEWSHHWLTFHPVGLNYGDPQVRIINETIASLIDQEVSAAVVARYYPEHMLPPPPPLPETTPPPTYPPPFDFQAEMEKTRIEVDRLLAAGKIEQAEAYMEARRQLFLENGYLIRKLNQAYFAFHGAYAAQPGAAGEDPIGPMLRDIRAQSPSLRDFMLRVASIGNLADLEEIWREETAVAAD